MPENTVSQSLYLPNWLFEQDYLVFLSFFGWMSLGLLSWTKPLSDREGLKDQWLWLGYFAFSQAMADFVKVLSFSDPFFRTFNISVPLEMLALGFLVELSVRASSRLRGKAFPIYGAIGCALLGFAIEVSTLLYSFIVAFVVSTAACLSAAYQLYQVGKRSTDHRLWLVIAGILLLVPDWILGPDHLAYLRGTPPIEMAEFPYYGTLRLLIRVVAAWMILAGLWRYRLGTRIEDVAAQVGQALRLWGFRVLPAALLTIIVASYFVTSWSGRRLRDEMRQDHIFRSETSALAFKQAWQGLENQPEDNVAKGLSRNLTELRKIDAEVANAYLWKGDEYSIKLLLSDGVEANRPLIVEAIPDLSFARSIDENKTFLVGPMRVNGRATVSANAPIHVPLDGSETTWLGIDWLGASWIRAISLSRLQAIVIVGLLLALTTFFLYYQIGRESEADLILAKERAEAGDRAKSEFLAVISHEIRTPLQSVLGYSNLLRDTNLDEKQIACLDTIQSEGKILLRIVQDILDFSNLRKASFELKDGPVQLRKLIEETYRTIRPMANRKGLEASLEIDDDLPVVVETDGVRLRQVLLNLFNNSVKYTDAGKVSLSSRREDSEDGPSRVVFQISDTGVGIEKKDLTRLFEPFTQLEHRAAAPREGAGLGLAIVLRIIELMGGTIAVESEVGRGSVFTATFAFPVIETSDDSEIGTNRVSRQGEADVDQPLLLGQRFPLKTLVADDNPMVRQLIVQYMQALGYAPDEAMGGQQAADMGPAYDLIVTDLRMPGVDGPSATAMIRERTGLKEQPWIIGVSATLAESEIERALDFGINEFLGKPFFPKDLEAKILAIPWLERLAELSDESEHARAEESAKNESADKPEDLGNSFGGAGLFSEEVVSGALGEVRSMHDEMRVAIEQGRFDQVEEKAHYIANSGMALGIDSLYADGKAVEKAAAARGVEAMKSALDALLRNLNAWEDQHARMR